MKKITLKALIGMSFLFSGCSMLSKNAEVKKTIQPDTALHKACQDDMPIYAWNFFAEFENDRETIYKTLQTPNQAGQFPLDFCRSILNSLVGELHKPNSKINRGDLHTQLITLNAVIEEMELYWEGLMADNSNIQIVILDNPGQSLKQ